MANPIPNRIRELHERVQRTRVAFEDAQRNLSRELAPLHKQTLELDGRTYRVVRTHPHSPNLDRPYSLRKVL